MPVLRWIPGRRAWQRIEDDAPDGLAGADVGLYETLMASATPYAMSLHADRVARSWEALTSRPLQAEPVPTLADARAEAIRQGWPALRFEVRWFPDGTTVAQLRRRQRPPLAPPLRLLPVEYGNSRAVFPHKSVDRAHLAQAHDRAVAAGADDALVVVNGEVREAAQAFVGLVTEEALVLPPLRLGVLPSTTRLAAGQWCQEQGQTVTERPIQMDELGRGGLVYGSALVGLLTAFPVGAPAGPWPGWFDGGAIARRLAG